MAVHAERAHESPASRPVWWIAAAIAVETAVFLFAARLLEPAPIYHDNAAIAYPTRVLVSTALWHGIFPLWDHWTHGGAPLCTLVVALPLSPIVLGLGVFGIYDQTTFVVELIGLHVLALVGMFSWLRTVADDDAAAVGALCYALSAVLLIQAPINIEAVATQAMIPWYALGLRKSLRVARRGAVVLALSLWVMFTTGYLGLNLFVVEILTPYVVADHLLVDAGGVPPGRQWRGFGHVAAGGLLFLGIVNLALVETYRHFGLNLTQVRQTPFDPFTGSAHPRALYTLLWPNRISPFVADASGAHVFPLYAGSVTVLLVLAALASLRPPWTHDARRVALLLPVVAIAFLATLSAPYGGKVFTTILPLYAKVRFHCWGLAVVVFLATTLGALGMRSLRERGGAGTVILVAFALSATGSFVLQRGVRDLAAIGSYPQCYTLPLVALVLSRFVPWSWPMRASLLVVLSVLEIGAVSTQIPSLRDGSSLVAAGARKSAAVLAGNERAKTTGFPAPPNERTPGAEGNAQYFTKVPTYAGYNPNIHPTIRRLQDNPRFAGLMAHIFYASDTDGVPARDPLDDVGLELTPNVVEARFNARAGPTLVTYSEPFTPAWRLRVDGVARETTQNAFGLTTFRVGGGPHHVELRYRPSGLAASVALSVVSLVIAFVIAVPSRALPIRAFWRRR
jgi:hypothetical protein